MAKIGVVGYGYVGRAVEYGFKDKNEVLVYDKYLKLLPLEKVVGEAEFVFICVPTPMDKNYSHIDLSIVEEVTAEVIATAKSRGREVLVVIKSTVIPGTTERLGKKYKWPAIVFNPEFLTEANYLEDFVKSDRIVIGGRRDKDRQRLVELYRDSFLQTKIFTTDTTTAEMVKYMANVFLATKVMFGNEMYNLCEKLGIKYEEVKEMVVADKRIHDSHLDVTTERGFGKKCLPKDTVALLGLARELGVKMEVVEAVWRENLEIRKVRDWEEIPGAVSTE